MLAAYAVPTEQVPLLVIASTDGANASLLQEAFASLMAHK
jgi:hypothetical protein